MIIVSDSRIKQRQSAMQFQSATADLAVLTVGAINVHEWVKMVKVRHISMAFDHCTSNILFDSFDQITFDRFFQKLDGWQQMRLQLVLDQYEENEIHHSVLFMNNILASMKI